MNPFQSANTKPDRDPEHVTRLFYRVQDGRLFERTGEKRPVQPGDFHWCNGGDAAPERVTEDNIDSICSRREGSAVVLVPHVCAIWKLAENQNAPILQPELPELPKGPIDRLIQRVELTREAMEADAVPLLTRAAVLASLHQVKALERIAKCLEAAYLEDKAPVYAGRPDFETSESRAVCSMCNHGEHAGCTGLPPQGGVPGITYSHCECPICHRKPTVSTPHGNVYDFALHPFEGMEDNHFCTKCGG